MNGLETGEITPIFARFYPFSCQIPSKSVPSAVPDVELEQHHITVSNDVLFPFRPNGACLSRPLPSTVFTRNKFVVRDRLGLDEAPLEIGVNHAGGLVARCRRDGSSRRALPARRP